MAESVPEEAASIAPQVAVDPAILASIKSPLAPAGVPATVQPPESLPGAVGLLEAIRAIYGSFHHGVAHAERMQRRHGEIYRTMYMAQPMVAVTAPDEVQKILRNEQNVWSSAMAWEFLFYDGLNVEGGNPGELLTLDFDAHRGARKLVQPAFSSAAIRGYVEIARPQFETHIGRWIDDGGVDLKPALNGLFPRISNRLLTGIEDLAQLTRFDRALRDISSSAQALVRTRRLNPLFSRASRAYSYITNYFVPLVPARRAQPGTDLFSQLCRVSGRAEGVDDRALVRIFTTMMLGAHDSTKLGLTSMAYMLAKHPDWQERLRAEANAIPRDGLDWDGLQRLEQLEWFWKETLRLMPITDFIPRRALRDVEIRGHRLRAGTLVGAMAGCVGRHPGYWKKPRRFDPERFSPERSEHKQHPAIYNPFGGGAHVCIGMQLATLEAKVFFHNLLTRSQIKLHRDYDAVHTYRPLGCVSGRVGLELKSRGCVSKL